MYDNTFTIHVQGAGQNRWTDEFANTEIVRQTCNPSETTPELLDETSGETIPKTNDVGVTVAEALENSGMESETSLKFPEKSLSFRDAPNSLQLQETSKETIPKSIDVSETVPKPLESSEILSETNPKWLEEICHSEMRQTRYNFL